MLPSEHLQLLLLITVSDRPSCMLLRLQMSTNGWSGSSTKAASILLRSQLHSSQAYGQGSLVHVTINIAHDAANELQPTTKLQAACSA